MLTTLILMWTLLILTSGFSVYERLNFDVTGRGARRSSVPVLHCLWLGLSVCAVSAALMFALAVVGRYLVPAGFSLLFVSVDNYIGDHGLASVLAPIQPLHVAAMSTILVVSFLIAPLMGAWVQHRRMHA